MTQEAPPPASPPPASPPRAPVLAGMPVALRLFTVIPAGRGRPELGAGEAAQAVPWLPAAGLAVALPAAALLLGMSALGRSALGRSALGRSALGGLDAPRRLLAAALAVTLTSVLTGGLHLDGLADTTDGLGSRRPREEALAIMRRSDIGAFGVVALVLVLALQVTALASAGTGWRPAAAIVVAVVTGRVAIVLATGPRTPAARPDGLGALVAGTTTLRVRATTLAVLLAAVAGAGAAAGGFALANQGVTAVISGLLAGELIRDAAVRRLGGVTGDVYGAITEIATTVVLVVLAL